MKCCKAISPPFVLRRRALRERPKHVRITKTAVVLTTPLWDLVLTSSFRIPYPGEKKEIGEIKKRKVGKITMYCTAWL